MTTHEIRTAYFDFFKTRGHALLPSASLLPENDPTTLFTSSGMQPLLPYLLGEPHPSGHRLIDSQKCFRTQDIEEVGDNRHTTFFEMLGNWSLGDYFKKDQIPWFFEFLTDIVGLDPKKLYVTCYAGNPALGIPKDIEAAELWQGLFEKQGVEAAIVDIGSEEEGYQKGMQNGERIFFYDGKKNWWSRGGSEAKTPMGDPCGPDTEVFYEFAEVLHDTRFGAKCHPNCDCGRFLEIGNLVFMAYKRIESGFELLPNKNVDFGGGLERIAAAKKNTPDIFQIDLFDGMRRVIENVSGKKYGADEKNNYAFRVIFDHLRAATFLIADGAIPSNKDQGYFTRRLIRRAVRFAPQIGIARPFCADAARAVIETYQDSYPEFGTKQSAILTDMEKEEAKFKQTLERGVQKFEEIAKQKESGGVVTSVEAFDLFQSFGFPLELTIEMAKERGLFVDDTGFATEREKHADISRQGAEKKFKGGLADHSEMSIKYHTATHLLHAAVLKVLGPHATQKGSNITPERLRFDFAHSEKPTEEQKKQIEDLVNAAISRDYPVSFAIMPLDEARKKGAIGLFEENYRDQVKVYTVGDPEGISVADPSAPTFSREFCGGPHVAHTGVLGHFTISKEEAISAGVRRIRAVLE